MDIKKYTNKAVDVTKNVANSVKENTSKVIEEEKEKYYENRVAGIDNWDDKLKKWLQDKGLSATMAKWQMNRVMMGYRKEEEIERGVPEESWIRLIWQVFAAFGIIGYAAFAILMITIFLLILDNLLNLIAYIPLIVLIKYISIHLKYKSNAKYFDYAWYLDLMKQDDGYRARNAKNAYLNIPHILFANDNELENYLENRGRKNMVSGQREFASISNSRIERDEIFGWVRVFLIDNKFFKKPVTSLEDVELSDYFIIPQRTSNHELTGNIYYAVHDEVRQSIPHLLGVESRDDFIEKIVNDSSINSGFPEISVRLAEIKERELEEEKARIEQEEMQKLEQVIKEKGLSKESVTIIKTIRKNKEKWSFNLWNVGENMEGSSKYFRVRCQLLGNATIKTVNSLIPAIERELRRSVIIKQLTSDKKSFELTVILSENLSDITISTEEMYEKYNSKGHVLLGDSYTGWQSYKFSIKNLQAFWTSGGPGSGKSWTNIFLLKNLIQLRNIDDAIPRIEEFYIVSDSKVSDYNFLQDKAFIAAGPENVLNLLNYLISKCEERERLFMEAGVTDILDYNKKVGYMSPFIVVLDEYENSVNTNMKNINKDYSRDEINQASAKLHRIMRSAGGISIVSTQSAILKQISDTGRYLNIKYFGRNNYSDLESAASAELANKFNELGQNGSKIQGLVGFQSKENLLKDAVFLDKQGTAMLKVPILQGDVKGLEDIIATKEFEEEIFQKNISEEEDELKDIDVEDLF